MPDTTYKRLDYDQTLFLTNLIFQHMKGSPLNRQYTLTPNADGTAWELRTSVDGGASSLAATIPAAGAAQAGLLSAAFHTKLTGIETGAERNAVAGVQVNGVLLSPDGNRYVNVTVPTAVSGLSNDSGYQTEAQVRAAIEAQLTAVYKPGGSCAFADLPAATAAHLGFVYDVTDGFTTTAQFVEGAGKTYPAGTDVAIVNAGTAAEPVYRYNVLPGFVDLSGYVQASQLATLTNTEITTAVQSAYTAVFGAGS